MFSRPPRVYNHIELLASHSKPANLRQARCCGALFYGAAFEKEEMPMIQDVLFLSTNDFRLRKRRTQILKGEKNGSSE